MSCNGCRVLRKGCGENCVLRPCLEPIQPPDAQANATLFLSKFFGRTDLFTFISAVPSPHQRAALFQSLLYEAVGRTLNPVNGATGLLSTGNWHLCEAAVQKVLSGGSPTPLCDGDGTSIPEVDESSSAMMIRNQTDASNSNTAPIPPVNDMIADDNGRDFPFMTVSDVAADMAMSCRLRDGEEPKLLNLF